MSERCSSSDRDGAVEELRRNCPVVRAHVVGVPRLQVAVVAERERSALPEVEHLEGAVGIVRVETHPGDDLAAEQPEVRHAPEVHGVDACARPTADAADLLSGHRGVDGSDHLGVAVPALDARGDDVRGHRDQLRLERRALGAQRLRDRGVIGDEAVRLGSVIASGVIAISHGRPPSRLSSRPRPRRRSRARPSGNVHAITHGTWNSRLTIPMWLRGVPPVQIDRGELVVDRSKERRARVADERDDARRPRCP